MYRPFHLLFSPLAHSAKKLGVAGWLGLVWASFTMQAVCADPVAAAESTARASELLRDDRALRRWVQDHQPEIQAVSARRREALAATRDVRLLPNPTLTLGVAGVTFGARNPAGLSFFDTQNYQATLAQTFEIGKRSHRIKSAELHAQSVDSDARYAEANLVADAREALAKLSYLQERQRVLLERLQSARGIVELDETRLDRGDVSGIDHRRLLLDVVNVERQLAENASDIAAAHADCTAAMGTTCVADITADQLDTLIPPLPAKLVARFEPASRPDVRAQLTEAGAQREQARLFENRSIPDPQIGISYLHDNLTYAGNQPHSFGLYVAMPLPVSDRGQHQQAQALARAEQLTAEAHRSELVASTQGQQLAKAEGAMVQKLSMLEERAVPLGVNVLDSTEKAYRLGQVSMTDLLLARRQRGELVLDLIDTRYTLFQIRSQLRRVLGLDVNGEPSPP